MEKENTPPEDDPNGGAKPHHPPKDSNGWDGKLRVDRKPALENPEAISDPEYSDEEHIIPGEEIGADEGMYILSVGLSSRRSGLIGLTCRSSRRLPARYR